jgi:hypothetical protein
MNCSRIKEILNDYVDNLLDVEDKSRVERHVAGCADCSKELEKLRSVIDGVRDLPFVKAPSGFRRGLFERIDGDREEPAGAAPASRESTLPPPSQPAGKTSLLFRILPLAVAALFLVTVTTIFVLSDGGEEAHQPLAVLDGEEGEETARQRVFPVEALGELEEAALKVEEKTGVEEKRFRGKAGETVADRKFGGKKDGDARRAAPAGSVTGAEEATNKGRPRKGLLESRKKEARRGAEQAASPSTAGPGGPTTPPAADPEPLGRGAGKGLGPEDKPNLAKARVYQETDPATGGPFDLIVVETEMDGTALAEEVGIRKNVEPAREGSGFLAGRGRKQDRGAGVCVLYQIDRRRYQELIHGLVEKGADSVYACTCAPAPAARRDDTLFDEIAVGVSLEHCVASSVLLWRKGGADKGEKKWFGNRSQGETSPINRDLESLLVRIGPKKEAARLGALVEGRDAGKSPDLVWVLFVTPVPGEVPQPSQEKAKVRKN